MLDFCFRPRRLGAAQCPRRPGATASGSTADNIANVDTPGFTASTVDFEDSLRGALADGTMTRARACPTTVAAHGPGRCQRQQRRPRPPRRMTAMQATFSYQLLTRAVGDRYGLITHRDRGHVMGAFDMMNIAGSGLSMHQTWLDTLSYNISNVNTARATSELAFQAQYAIAQSAAGPEGGEGVARLRHRPRRPAGPDGLPARPPARRRRRLHPDARHRPRQPDEPADHGPARLPGPGVGASATRRTSTPAPSRSASSA